MHHYLSIGYQKVEPESLSEEQKDEIQNHIGCLTEMAQALSKTAGLKSPKEDFSFQIQNLCFATEFINEIVLDLNGLLQK